MSHNQYIVLIIFAAFAYMIDPVKCETAFEPLPDTVEFCDYLKSKEFQPDEMSIRWNTFHSEHVKMNELDPTGWERNLNHIFKSGLMTNSPIVARALLDLDYPEIPRKPVFNADRGLYMVAHNSVIDEESAGRIARILMEYGASPMQTGLTRNPVFAGMTVLEIAIRQQRPSVVQALLMDPSPLQFETLEAMGDSSKEARRGIEVYRSKVIRQRKNEEITRILKDEKFYVFAESYLNMLILILFFVIFVTLLISFLFHLRIKRIPVDSQLCIPRSATVSIWVFAGYFVSTLLSTVPTGTLFQVISVGIGLVGSLIWCGVFTARSDLFAVLLISVLLQTIFTVTCYYIYAPCVQEETASDPEECLVKVMLYPKSSDWSRAVGKSTMFVFSCSTSLFITFSALDPITRMYWCPAVSVSDTYGFDWSWFRMFAICWDVVIFFTLTLRIQRVIDTVTAYDLIGKFHTKGSVAQIY